MASTYTQYYQAQDTYATANYASMSVRAMYDHSANVNNWKRAVGNFPLVLDGWPDGEVSSPDSTGVITVLLHLGRHYIPEGYTHLRWWINTKRFQGTSTTQWRLTASKNLYIGPETLDTDLLIDAYTGIITSADSDVSDNATSLLPIPNVGWDHQLFLMLSANNIDDGGATSRANLYDLSIQPERVAVSS